ncbi:hypothetical protein [Candidimonas nitroreducens]|uniref:Uncharacterized protein n=1 Tax=Candidimonas nitroreducens TaxID=683354 RepID=A0A225LVI4_9BURK|nr:hypothetical protein [Candidimonas nitroreducens]OWT53387.1 hypothetical protein CEY11_24855 [Candidimonas nitroreducens]
MTVLELNPIPEVDATEAEPPAAAPAPTTPSTLPEIVQHQIDNGADMAQLTRMYLRLRDSEKDLKVQAAQRLAPLRAAMDLIESKFLDQMNELKVDSLKNEAGTPYKKEHTTISVADNETFIGFVLDRSLEALPVSADAKAAIKNVILNSGQLALIEARASKSAVEAYLEETQELPPGLNRSAAFVVNVRSN